MLNLVRQVEELYTAAIKPMKLFGLSPTAVSAYHGFMTMRTKLRTWYDGERKRFVLSKNLVEAFSHTDIPLDLQVSDFQYPFDCFMVESQVPLFHTNLPTGVYPVFSILFLTADYLMKDPDVRFYFLDGRQSDKPEWQYSLTAFYSLNRVVESLMLNIGREETLAECADNRRKDPGMLALDPADVSGLANVFFNTLLYISDPRRKPEETQAYRQDRIKDGRGGKYRECPYILLRPPADYRLYPSADEPGRPLDRRFIVRGHWRNQAHGERLSLRRMTWIKPFWKGPELASVVSKPYKVV